MTEFIGEKLKSEHFESILDISPEKWDCISSSSTGLKHSVLSTFELSGVNDIQCHYMFFEMHGEGIGKANIYETSMDFKTMDRTLSEPTKRAIKEWHHDFLDFSMVECGL